LIILDEAPGVTAEIWEAIEGVRAGDDVRVLALGNPTIASGAVLRRLHGEPRRLADFHYLGL
jgi:hypothetical protein